jgi:large subunit ribosomal protein L15
VQQHELRPPRGATKGRKRLGRGNASGQGTYAGKGLKGQQARAGGGPRPGFEGGQTPLIRRLPRRRGFHNPFRVEYQPVNLSALAKLPADSEVTPEALRDAGIIRSLKLPVKLLGEGEVAGKLSVRVHRVSASARAKIEAAGGTVEELIARKERVEKPKAEAAPEEPEQPSGEEQDDSDSASSTSPAAE